MAIIDADDANRRRRHSSAPSTSESEHEDWLQTVAESASRDTGGVPTDLLGDYLRILADAATHGRRPDPRELEAVELLGRRAAQAGISAGRGVDLYLSAARRVWGELPAVVRERDSAAVRAAAEAVLQVVDDAVAAFAQGHADAGRAMVRQEETLRREFVEDLLRGDAHLSELVQRAEPFGLDLTRGHQVALAAPSRRLPDIDASTRALEHAVVAQFGDRDVLVATKDGMVVVLVPAGPRVAGAGPESVSAASGLGGLIHTELSRIRRGRPWRVASGRWYPGVYGIARSYEEAREGLAMAARMHLDRPVIDAGDILIYRVLFRDQPAIVDLVHDVLAPLSQARGGERSLLETLDAYFASGNVATEAATRLHLSVRAVTYRLDRIRRLTGYDPGSPDHRLTLHVAVVGARLLGWPGQEFATEGDATMWLEGTRTEPPR